MRLVVDRGRVADLADLAALAALAAERVYYASHVDVLEADHPGRRFVAALSSTATPSTPDAPVAPRTRERLRPSRGRC
jgi:hypothetical protein